MIQAPAFPHSYDPVRWWGAAAPARVAVVDHDHGSRHTYGELDRLADRRAAWLLAQGCRAGDRVAVLAPNCVETVIVYLAALRIGAALVPLNWRLAAGELAAVLDDAQPALALHHPSLSPPAGPVTWHLLEPVSTGDGAYEPPDDLGADMPALLLYTSGSTGSPKGVVLPRRQVLFNAIATCSAWELGPDDIAPVSTPLFHTGGWNVFATPLWHCGGRIVLTERFDATTFLTMMAEEGCTVALTVPTQLVMLRAAPDWGRPLPALRRFFSGGAPCPPSLADAVRNAGYTLREGYGLTECGPNCFSISDDEAASNPGAVGRPIMFLQARLCDENGRDVADGDVGELCLRGPQMFAGYFRDPERTRDALTDDGWLRTGDLARRDAAGLFSICGRRKEMYISGGENVFPGEVEAALLSCDGVAEAVVIGVEDFQWGEVGHAFVVTDSTGVDGDDILRALRTALAGYKVPRHLTFLTDLPRLDSGKIDRRSLLGMTAMQEDA